MSINGVGSANSFTQSQLKGTTDKKKDWSVDLHEKILNPKDTYTPSKANQDKDVKGKQVDSADKAWPEANAATEALRKLVERLIGNYNDSNGQSYWALQSESSESINININININISSSEDIKAKAEQLVSEDGFYGVKKTTERIMNFAKSLAGEEVDSEKIETLRKAAQEGFTQAAQAFGGVDNLPQISRDTYDAVMKEFDSWLESVGTESE